ncbi:hypothetical protein I4U23_019694 [Adineta vaga]|nr:hypothetical protein I4U23_019694 [Adineta vaga]
MSIVNALSSLSLFLPMTNDTYMQTNQLLSCLHDKYDNDPISILTDVVQKTTLNSSEIKDRHSKINRIYRPLQKSSMIVKHGLSYMKKPHVLSSTIRTGHHSKLTRSNELTRKSKIKQDLRRQQLEEQVRELEYKQDNLLTQVEDLYLYKYELETKWQRSNSNSQLIL